MADNVAITPGAGATVATDDVGGVQYQRVKIDGGGNGLSEPIAGDATYGLDVDVTRVSGTVTVGDGGSTISVDDGGGILTVDSAQLPSALVGGRLDVRIGAQAGTIAVDDASSSLTVDTPQLPAALVGGRLDVNIGASTGSMAVSDGGSTLSVDDGGGALTVDGTVTAAQGTAAALSAAWPVKVSDGTDYVGISTVSSAKCLKVDVVRSPGIGTVVVPTVTPTVSSSPDYSSGDCIGGLLSFTNAVSEAGRGGLLNKAIVTDQTGSNVAMDLVLFDAALTTTPVDNDPFDLDDADLSKIVGVFSIVDWSVFADNSVGMIVLEQAFKISSGTTLYGVLIARGTLNLATTSDITVRIAIQQG